MAARSSLSRARASARAAPGGQRGHLGGEPLELEKLKPYEVLVNIYDLDLSLSDLRRPDGLPRLLQAKPYAGVEIYGREWGYNFVEEEVSGISESKPRRRPEHSYCVTLEMGRCSLSEEEVSQLLARMCPAWRGPEYNDVHNNCLDFCDALCCALGVGVLPRPRDRDGRDVKEAKRQDASCSLWSSVSSSLLHQLRDAVLGLFDAPSTCRGCDEEPPVLVPKCQGGFSLSREPTYLPAIAGANGAVEGAACDAAAPAFWRLPSVGTWLRARPREPKGEGAAPEFSEFSEVRGLRDTQQAGERSFHDALRREVATRMELRSFRQLSLVCGQEVLGAESPWTKAAITVVVRQYVQSLEGSAEAHSARSLLRAAHAGEMAEVEALLEAPCDPDAVKKGSLRTALYAAAEQGHVDVARCLLAAGADVNKVDENGRTAMYAAALNGHQDVVREFLEAGADKDHTDNEGQTPLQIAATCRHVGAVRCLLRARALVNRVDRGGCTPLHHAAREGHPEVVQCLLAAGAEKDQAGKGGDTPLLFAAAKNRPEVVSCLLEAGADMNKANKSGFTALHVAASSGLRKVFRYMLEAGADKDKASKGGLTALHFVAMNGHQDFLSRLLEAGADKDKADDEGATPLHATALNGHQRLLRCLLSAGADKDKTDKDGRTPLNIAARSGHQEELSCLLEAGADKDKADHQGFTPLHAAAFSGQEQALGRLLEAGAHLDLTDKEGRTPMNVAAWHGHTSAVQRLLEARADKDKADRHSCTPLIAAARNGHEEAARRLLEVT
ncbi:unnamed protein product [Effrenium voratum]|uniref:PPPDE domain-containing protein n=1 Tax=Effrenium voratum TaxID=2562239 RepID=A0AA36HRC3_9DINO|nr:unnamed protein product [Effrenium voratum]